MLVLTRKLDQQILIGENIRVTLLKTRGNTVRIGIDAPREVRVVRGELSEAALAAREPDGEEASWQPSEREQPFAHPPESWPARQGSTGANEEAAPGEVKPRSTNRLAAATSRRGDSSRDRSGRSRRGDPHLYVGSVGRRGQDARLKRAPLAGRVPTS